jgi:hypothetical protein
LCTHIDGLAVEGESSDQHFWDDSQMSVLGNEQVFKFGLYDICASVAVEEALAKE